MTNEELIIKVLDQKTIMAKVRVGSGETEKDFVYKTLPVTAVETILDSNKSEYVLDYIIHTQGPSYQLREFGEWWML